MARDKEKKKAADRARYLANPEMYRARVRAWKKANPEKAYACERNSRAAKPEAVRAYMKKYAAEHPAEIAAAKLKYSIANADKLKASARLRRKTNPGPKAADVARRRAMKLKATPAWVDRKALRAIYIEAAKRRLEVDHIHPLRHPRLCGLHVPWNLQLLTRSQNASKGNKLCC